MSVESKIREYILDNFLFTNDESQLSNEASLIEGGILDSTGILELVGFIEEEFGLTIEDEELVPENLGSVDNIVRFVSSKAS